MNSYEDILRESFSEVELTLSPTEEAALDSVAETNLFGEKYIVPSFMVEAAMDLKRFEMESAAEKYIFSKYDEYTCEAFGLAESDEMKRAITESFKDKMENVKRNSKDFFIKLNLRIKEFVIKAMAYLRRLSVKFMKWMSINKDTIEKAKENQKNMAENVGLEYTGLIVLYEKNAEFVKLVKFNNNCLKTGFQGKYNEFKSALDDMKKIIKDGLPKANYDLKALNIDQLNSEIKDVEKAIEDEIDFLKKFGNFGRSQDHKDDRLDTNFSQIIGWVFEYINIRIKLFNDLIKRNITAIRACAKYKPATESFDYNFFFED